MDALRDALTASGAPGDFAPLMADYFGKVKAGFYKRTDTVARLLGRAPRAYADWLQENLPVVAGAAAE